MVWINCTTTRNQQNWWTTKPNVAKLSIFLIFYWWQKRDKKCISWCNVVIDFDCSIQSCHSGTISHRIWYKSSIFYEISKTSSFLNHFRNTLWFLSFSLQLTSIIFFLAKNQAWNHSFSIKIMTFQTFLAPKFNLIFYSELD